MAYNTYSLMINGSLNNPFEAIMKFYRKIFGFTMLDVFVVLTIPYTNILSNTFYLRSFKNAALKFSNICVTLTNLNKELNESLDLISSSEKKMPRMGISLKIFISSSFIASIIILLQCVSMFMMLQGNIQDIIKVPITDGQRYIYFVNLFVCTLCWEYPCITISADLIICEILEKHGEIYLHWNEMLKEYLKRLQPFSHKKVQQNVENVDPDER